MDNRLPLIQQTDIRPWERLFVMTDLTCQIGLHMHSLHGAEVRMIWPCGFGHDDRGRSLRFQW